MGDTSFKPLSHRPLFLGQSLPEEIRILTMDGGGIYGYSTALLLRRLCEQDETFLTGDKIWMFAGTSAGALNALMLARAPKPREVVMRGELERFWHQRGIFANELNPWDAYGSWLGLTAWLGTADFEKLLKEQYGDLKMGELPHRVMITTYNWSGVGERQPCWCPKVFVNFPEDEPDRSALVRDIAYAAGAPPGLRGVLGGYGDGGTANPDPSRAALVEVVKKKQREEKQRDLDKQTPSVLGVLDDVRMLSLGVCPKPWGYGQHNFNLGASLFYSVMPTDPLRQVWWPPCWQISVDSMTEAANHTCEVLLGEDFFRLSPPLLGPPEVPPMMAATLLSRFPVWQDYLIEFQDRALSSSLAGEHIQRAVEYLKNKWNK